MTPVPPLAGVVNVARTAGTSQAAPADDSVRTPDRTRRCRPTSGQFPQSGS